MTQPTQLAIYFPDRTLAMQSRAADNSSSQSETMRTAVSVLVTRQAAQCEVLLVRRNPELKFLGGYLAFPGGTLDPEDQDIPIAECDRHAWPSDVDLRPFVAAAARELFEETGIWLGRGTSSPDAVRLREYRRRMLSGEILFADILRAEGHRIEAPDFTPVCRITTPPYASRRYDTWFLHCRMPPGATLEIWPGELHDGRFVTAQDAMRGWRAGEELIAPPVVTLLQAMGTRPWEAFLSCVRSLTEGYRSGKLQRDFYSCGVLMCPLTTPTKPPATNTNFFVVGDQELFLVDPAATEPDEQARLWELLDELVAEGRTLKGILLTHGHPDHIDAVAACSHRYQLPIFAHRLTVQGLPHIQFSGYLEHDQEIDLGTSPDGSPGWKLRVFHLPGHAPGHLAFQESRYRAIIVGDLVSPLSSILIDPSDGHLATYLESLQLLESVADGVLYPGHGPPVRAGRETVQKAIRHRREREKQLVAALQEHPKTMEALLEALYGSLDPRLMHWAGRSLQSGLIKLMEEGRVRQTPEGYELAPDRG